MVDQWLANKQLYQFYYVKQLTNKMDPREIIQFNPGPAGRRFKRKRSSITYAKNVQTAETQNQRHCNEKKSETNRL